MAIRREKEEWKMNINPRHKQDGIEAWEKSGFRHGQNVVYQGEFCEITAIGYGMLLEGKCRIRDKNGNEHLVLLKDLKGISEGE